VPDPNLTVGVVFGGRSVEHDVSIITGVQAVEALSARHRPIPIHIDREGRWRAGDELRRIDRYAEGPPPGDPARLDLGSGELVIASGGDGGGGLLRRRAPEERRIRLDVIVNATHGTQGEDGCLQGALELADIPYVGPTVEGAAVAMNKALTKTVLRAAGLPVVDDLLLRRTEWDADHSAVVRRASERFPLPVYVKPATLGSSVGVSRCATEAELEEALTLGFELDRSVLVEPAVEGGIEVNCAVLGRPGVEPRASVCEQPVSEGFLSFHDKYLRGGGGGKGATAAKDAGAANGGGAFEAAVARGAKDADTANGGGAYEPPVAGGAKGGGMASAERIIPAPIGDSRTAEIQRLARDAFTAIGGAGVCRVDFLVDAEGRAFVNECNTIPGSFSFYLWEPAGLPFCDLLDELLDLALGERAEQRRTTRVFASNLLAARAGVGSNA
jgi:D-alanine-D-alanine ligase